jgi:uncharacterized membrane protein YjfL (UPF0719 family)
MLDVLLSLLEIFYNLLLCILIGWFSFFLFSKLTKNIDELKEIKENNCAVALILAATLLSVAMIIKQASFPMISIFQTIIEKGISFGGLIKILGISLSAILISMAISVIAIWLAIQIFIRLTKEIDEWNEIKKNNTAIAIILAALILIVGILMGQGIESLLDSIVPGPILEKIKVM